MDKVRCKFTCESVTKTETQESISMRPVTSGSEEDNSFSKYTPCGQLELSVTNENCFGFFVPGEAYYLDIVPAKEAQE